MKNKIIRLTLLMIGAFNLSTTTCRSAEEEFTAAQNGDIEAQMHLADAYYTGASKYIPKGEFQRDKEKALECYCKAAKQGDSDAYLNIISLIALNTLSEKNITTNELFEAYLKGWEDSMQYRPSNDEKYEPSRLRVAKKISTVIERRKFLREAFSGGIDYNSATRTFSSDLRNNGAAAKDFFSKVVQVCTKEELAFFGEIVKRAGPLKGWLDDISEGLSPEIGAIYKSGLSVRNDMKIIQIIDGKELLVRSVAGPGWPQILGSHILHITLASTREFKKYDTTLDTDFYKYMGEKTYTTVRGFKNTIHSFAEVLDPKQISFIFQSCLFPKDTYPSARERW